MFDKKTYARKYYEKNKEKIKRTAIAWNREHPDLHYMYKRKCEKTGTIKGMTVKEYQHNYYVEHKEKLKTMNIKGMSRKEYIRKYYAEHKKTKGE